MQNSELTPSADFAPEKQGENDIAHIVEKEIQRKANGTIHNLEVCICPQSGDVTIRGSAGTYYAKQSAGEGAMAFNRRVKNLIEVI